MNKKELTEKHNLVNETIFRFKTIVLIGNRFLKNLLSPQKKFNKTNHLSNEAVIAFSESDLWNPFDNKDNWILTAGKIENLRIAAKKINGLEIKAYKVFSFWKHIGNPNFGQGFVVGREIREGCIIPTIAGGLCQLSNALYDAALKANFDIVERHKHSKVIKGSLAEQDRDATVKWNYIDLRFRSSFDFKIGVELTSEKLIVTFQSKQKNINSTAHNSSIRHSNELNDCYSCGNFACFKHPDRTYKKDETATTTFVLDEKWPEFDSYVKSVSTDVDKFIVPLKKNRLIKSDRYSWSTMSSNKISYITFQGVYRAIKLRYASQKKNNIFELMLQLDKKIARKAARQIPFDSTHVVISQNLLPFVYETGALGGRTFDILMTRLPFEKLHERLDYAHSIHPQSPTLNDFRAPIELIELENKALTKARKIITTHTEIAKIFKNKVEKLEWQMPTLSDKHQRGNRILFPASAVGRKGAYEIKKLAKELNLNLTIIGRTIENDNFWEDVKIEKFDGDFNQIALVIYPTYIEAQPRQILKAISKDIPIITTTACGLDKSKNVKVVELGDYEKLKTETMKILYNNV